MVKGFDEGRNMASFIALDTSEAPGFYFGNYTLLPKVTMFVAAF